MIKRSTRITIIISVIVVIIIGIAIPLYFNFSSKTAYQVTAVEKTEFTAADFAEKSELQFNANGTFHVHIAHKEKGLSLTGIGTYTTEGKTYQLKFIEIFARDNNGDIVNYMDKCNDITCARVGNRIKFTDHKYQIFYFG